MKSTLVTAAAFALLLLGCLKPQPAVEVPTVINIPPLPKTEQAVIQAVSVCWPRLIYTVPAGWEVESKEKESVTLRRRDVPDAVIVTRVTDDESTDSPERDAEAFQQSVSDALVKRGVTASSYRTSAGQNAEFVLVRFSSEMGCGTSSYVRTAGPPARFIVTYGEWPCDDDVNNDAAIMSFMFSLKLLTE